MSGREELVVQRRIRNRIICQKRKSFIKKNIKVNFSKRESDLSKRESGLSKREEIVCKENYERKIVVIGM